MNQTWSRNNKHTSWSDRKVCFSCTCLELHQFQDVPFSQVSNNGSSITGLNKRETGKYLWLTECNCTHIPRPPPRRRSPDEAKYKWWVRSTVKINGKTFGVVKSGPLTLNFVVKNLKSGNRSIYGTYSYGVHKYTKSNPACHVLRFCYCQRGSVSNQSCTCVNGFIPRPYSQ